MLVGLLVLAACGSVSVNLDGNSSSGSSAPIIQIAQAPEDAARAFLDAWNHLDYQTMYKQLSTTSQGLFPYSTFLAIYQDADKTLGTKGVTYTLHETHTQGTSAAISYDAAIQSSVFGAIEDNGRTMRVTQAPDNTWHVAWSTMDIINGYANGTKLTVVAQRPARGNIYDRNGKAMVQQGGTVTELDIVRQNIPDEGRCVDLLSVLLRENRADLTKMIESYNPDTIIPIGDMDPDIFAARQSDLQNTCAINSAPTRTTRDYVGHGIATHLIGYVGQIPTEDLQTYLNNGYEQGDLVGLAGIEQQYESDLAGKSQRVLQIVEPGGMIVRQLAGTSGSPAHDITLTLDLNLQWATAQALSDAYNAASGGWAGPTHSPGAGAVVIDIHTGAILALASYPSFDPGIFNPDTPIFQVGNYIAALKNDPRSPFTDRAVQEQYSPGSTFKLVTLAATAQEGIFKPDQLFDCEMEWDGASFGDTLPKRFDWRATETGTQHFPTGEVNMVEALASSCDPFFYQMGAELFNKSGPTTLEDYARQMGLGSTTGFALDTPPEAKGNLPVLKSADEAISAAVGQLDTQVTALQMARMVAGIANGGTLYTPYVVQQIGGENNSAPTFTATPTVAGNMGLSQSTLDIVRQGMCEVTTTKTVGRTGPGAGQPLGTAYFVFDDVPPDGVGIAPYSVCGKTGTAQTARTEPNGWFVAYAPADNPQVAVAVVVPYGREGSETAAPIARRILDAYFNAPQAPWPSWWVNLPYIPINVPDGSMGGG